MSNSIVNIRIFYWHIQINRDWPFIGGGFNRYHVGRGSPWVEIYEWRLWR